MFFLWFKVEFVYNVHMNKILITDVGVIAKVCEVLKNGGVVMHPTETCYGLAVDIFNVGALKKLYELKGRDAGKPVSILVSGFDMAKGYGEFSDIALKIAQKYWPGPLSIVVPRSDKLPSGLNKGGKFISIRFSGDDFCTGIVREFGRPITTTSANLSGKDPLYEADFSVFGELSGNIDLVIDGGKIVFNKPSTIVKVEGGVVTVLRQGEVVISV